MRRGAGGRVTVIGRNKGIEIAWATSGGLVDWRSGISTRVETNALWRSRETLAPFAGASLGRAWVDSTPRRSSESVLIRNLLAVSRLAFLRAFHLKTRECRFLLWIPE
jgi:hypothetical protein